MTQPFDETIDQSVDQNPNIDTASPRRPGASVYAERLRKVTDSMATTNTDALILSVGHDLPWLVGYEAMPLERLTLLVVRPGEMPRLLIPALEAARVTPLPGVFEIAPWSETDDPVARAAALLDGAQRVAVGDQMWARFLVELLAHTGSVSWTRATEVIGPHRMVKDAAEVAALAAAGAGVDQIARDLQSGAIPLIGRTEADVSRDLAERILAAGHQRVNFAIVAAGENAASPHHHAGDRVIAPGEIVLCDFGGTMNGYCSDITRCVFTGDLDAAPEVRDAYQVLFAAQRASFESALVGTPCEDVDRAARTPIADAGYGEYFIHRTGHGIGMEEHEDPYIVAGNRSPIRAGNAFSIEPGIYVEHAWGMRLEDIVVATDAGPVACNDAPRELAEVEA